MRVKRSARCLCSEEEMVGRLKAERTAAAREAPARPLPHPTVIAGYAKNEVGYYESKQPGLGAELEDEVDAVLHQLLRFPESAPQWADRPHRRIGTRRGAAGMRAGVASETAEAAGMATAGAKANDVAAIGAAVLARVLAHRGSTTADEARAPAEAAAANARESAMNARRAIGAAAPVIPLRRPGATTAFLTAKRARGAATAASGAGMAARGAIATAGAA